MNQTERIGTNKPNFFFDTYAFFEILEGNPDYERYRHTHAITSIFNLAELNYNLNKEKSKEFADLITDTFSQFIIPVFLSDIKAAMDFKIKNKKLSIPMQ